ncbi:glycosyltransferase family 4 protein [Furfurilactobacillus siliginis]|uniref:1,2-diacylglycerol 3-glucosyltransferase n=1 Tax=Furfurilactobacillus siliginis TaxID=348151 RepID=A0A0R2L5V7_9LACO|nr:glycosyltransferase family 4 protein [Furfurilactobacillus siliginis]KRN95301.1 glycosyltransferase [Furfurilactobacillus siliginis]GEK28301.1 1,2-diacylglycerol 3-glucosyltransferase [Furfurilactobacillus siliginis]
MNIGIFTDTYFPQVSGVATSIKTLRDQLEQNGHSVYIFTSTDPKVDKDVYERNIFRFPSVPFVSFTDRRIAVRGVFHALQIAKDLHLDIIHTQTEFSMGLMGKFIAHSLKIPVVHTYHTMYEDYLHYVANGKLLRPKQVRSMTRAYLHGVEGVVAPSDRVLDTLTEYGIKTPIRVIPTGVNLPQFEQSQAGHLRQELGFADDTPVMLSLSRLAFEKNIHEVIMALPDILSQQPTAQLVIVGDGPARADLERQVTTMKLTDHVTFTGEVVNERVGQYYQMADVFVSASDSESQGLTYIEAIAAHLPIVVMSSPYADELLSSPAVGQTFHKQGEFVSAVANYLAGNVDVTDETTRQRILYEISADAFGKRIIQFYADAQLLYQDDSEKSAKLSD